MLQLFTTATAIGWLFKLKNGNRKTADMTPGQQQHCCQTACAKQLCQMHIVYRAGLFVYVFATYSRLILQSMPMGFFIRK
jgi:hypothetical protein